jgi:hypothetical protein
MPIERNLTDLPPARTAAATRNWAPDPHTRVMHVLAEKWMAQEEGNPRPKAADTRFRHSDGGGCARAIAYAALDVPQSNPVDIAGYWVMGAGKVFHDLVEDEMKERYGMEAEVTCIVDGFDGSGHADGVLTHPSGEPDEVPPWRVCIEYKSTGGYAFKMAVGERSQPQGPKWSAVVQGALNAYALHADELIIGLVSYEAISKAIARSKGFSDVQRFCAEWTLTRDEYRPIAEREMARVVGILEGLDRGVLPARTLDDPTYPERMEITNPRRGIYVEYDENQQVVDQKTTWHCSYCRWQDMCALTPSFEVPLEVLRGPPSDQA